MALADDLKPLIHSIRGIPGSLGLRPYSVAIITDSWAGGYVGGSGGNVSNEPVPITEGGGQPPKVRFESEDPLSKPICTIGPITPEFGSAGGTALSQLALAVDADQAAYVFLTGPLHPDGARYAVKEVRTDRAMHWLIICEHSDFQPEAQPEEP